MRFILFFIILALLIIVHEGGHFIIGKRSGIAVDEFSIGFGPPIFHRFIHGTLYSLRVLPFGGYCRFLGQDEFFDEEDDEDEGDAPPSLDNSHQYTDQSSDEEWDLADGVPFSVASVWARIATVFAGPFMNFVLAFFLALFVIGNSGTDMPRVLDVMEGYPAEEAGLKPGDFITSINGRKIDLYRDISLYMMLKGNEKLNVSFLRDGAPMKTVIIPRYDQDSDRYLLGIYGSGEREKGGPLFTVKYSLIEVRYWIEATWKSLGLIFKGRVTKDDIAGPIEVAKIVGDVYEESRPSGIYYIWINMMSLTILLSANIGVMNLLPFPALDGGRLIFLLYEAVTRRKVNSKIEMAVTFAGVCVLLLIMVAVMINDITRFLR